MKKIFIIILLVLHTSLAKADDSVTRYKKPLDISAYSFYGKDNKAYTTNDFVGNNTIIFYWAKRCGHCKRSLPSLNKFAKIIKKEKGINLIMLSSSDDWSNWQQSQDVLDDYGLDNLNSYLDKDDSIMADLNITGTPNTFLLNKKGKIFARIKGSADWSSKAVVNYIYNLVDNH